MVRGLKALGVYGKGRFCALFSIDVRSMCSVDVLERRVSGVSVIASNW